MYDPVSRREFLRRAALAGAATATASMLPRPLLAATRSPNEKLNLGVIGVAAQGRYNLDNVATENIVALCDIDAQRLAGAKEAYPKAETYADYRQLLERKDLDGVVIATPDHSHAIPTAWALKAGLDVYCEKPLAHSVWEVRQVRELAKQHNAVTQMGTQIHAGDNYRRVVELIKSGAIGPVRKVLVWQGNRIAVPGVRVAEATPPAHVDYDLWVGPAPMRPFHPSHFHFNWRYWFDFGGGILADMGCHYIDLPYWALDLRAPTKVSAKGELAQEGENDVPAHMQADWHFAARGEQPAVDITWYHGSWMPEGAEEYKKGAAVLFEGDRGRLLADYGSRQLFMNDGATVETPEPSIPNSIGHHQEWIAAVKSRGPTTCNFDYSGALAEAVLLGNVAYRSGEEISWDADKLTTNSSNADQYLKREYRQGWVL
ncbi:MAG: Gfo/Idh/MocA family oxidoreductase [Pirellulales bacterium]|nr:Gfo/Idh/MocA family oxidoreductase [Pirellulales bacterium]